MNLLRILVVLTIGLLRLSPVAEASGPPQPLVLLYVRDPWLMVFGSDSPSFALYNNDLVTYASGKKKAAKAFLSRLFPLDLLNRRHHFCNA